MVKKTALYIYFILNTTRNLRANNKCAINADRPTSLQPMD